MISCSTWSRLGMIDILILSAVMHVQCLCFTIKTAATRFTLRTLFKLIIVSKFKKCLVVLCCQSFFWKRNFVCTALCSLYVFTKGQHTKPPFVLLKNFNQNGTYKLSFLLDNWFFVFTFSNYTSYITNMPNGWNMFSWNICSHEICFQTVLRWGPRLL